MNGQDRFGRARASVVLVLLALVTASCSGSSSGETTTTTEPASTTTTVAPSTSTSVEPPTTTTEAPIVPIVVTGLDDASLAAAVAGGLTTLRDPRADGPVAAGALDHHGALPELADSYQADATMAELADGSRVAVVTLGDAPITDDGGNGGDVLLLADDVASDTDRWEVVGTSLPSVAADPWFGESPRRILVLGSDARPGGDPLVHRMDSIHILTSVPAEHTGTILGYPRDSWIDSPYGSMRINALTSSSRGPDAIFEHFTETWGVPLEGYIVTGFAGFEDLVAAAFGRLTVTIPISIPQQEWFDGFRKGEQTLNPTRLLDFSRTRKLIPGGDFTRSFHHGVVMLAALSAIQDGSIHGLPPLLAELTRFTTTSLTATDLLQLGAAAMDMDIGSITNEVLPGSLGRAGGGASVVFLDPGFEQIVDDVIDDGIRNGSS
jgi:anionic cell wall polymer biosynthesis LytR-Cps2A-Psr (LCP) family protein